MNAYLLNFNQGNSREQLSCRLIKYLRLVRSGIFTLAISLTLYSAHCDVLSAQAEDTPPDEKNVTENDGDKKGEKPKAQKPDRIASSGLLLGHLLKVDEKRRYIYVKPLEEFGKRRTFYLDASTLIKRERVSIPFLELKQGQKVGVRYFGDGNIFLAEGIFLIPGEVELKDLQMPKKKIAPKEEGEKKEGGGEGAKAKEGGEKPAAKPKKEGH